MIDGTHHYIARLAITVALGILAALCASILHHIEQGSPPQDVSELRFRHVLPIIGLGSMGLTLGAFALAIFH